jgi:hypothetical protein
VAGGSDPRDPFSPFPFGDVNRSGTVNAVDVQLVVNAALDIPVTVDCDLSGDESVNAVDIQLVVNAALGLV